MAKLSPTQIDAIETLKIVGKLVRWEGGFWTWEGAETDHIQHSAWGELPVPEWYCDLRTLRALESRGLVTLNEVEKVCDLKTK